jgi:hypothetical protein
MWGWVEDWEGEITKSGFMGYRVDRPGKAASRGPAGEASGEDRGTVANCLPDPVKRRYTQRSYENHDPTGGCGRVWLSDPGQNDPDGGGAGRSRAYNRANFRIPG